MFRSATIAAAALAGMLLVAGAPARAQEEPAAPAAPAPAAPAAPAAAPAQGVALPEAAQPTADAPAGGSSCDKEFQGLANARIAQIGALNRLSKGKGGKMDPIAACGKLQALAGIEARMVAYVDKNKDWCGIPDNIVDNIKKGRQGTLSFAGKACAAAGQFKKALAQRAQQQRAAANGGGQAAQGAPQIQKLPAGPL